MIDLLAADNDEDFVDVQCKCYNVLDTDSINSELPIEKFSVIHQNIRSFNKNYDEFSVFLDSLTANFSVIVFTETWFGESTCSEIDGYIGYHVFRDGRRGGGVSVYVRSDLKSTGISDLMFVDEVCEMCSVRVNINSNISINVIGVYRPPNQMLVQFHDTVRDRILSFFPHSQRVLVCGDLNIDLLQPCALEGELVDIMHSFSYLPLINLPTHVTSNNAKLLDHLWFNQLSPVVSAVIKHNITDHYAVFSVFEFRTKGTDIVKQFRDHSATSISNLGRAMSDFLSSFNVYSGLCSDLRVKIFLDKFVMMYDKYCPLRKKIISFNRFSKPWITAEIADLLNYKYALWQDVCSGRETIRYYRDFKNNLTTRIRQSKKNYYNVKFNRCRDSIKTTWRNINKILKNNRSCSLTIDKIVHEGSSVTGSENISRVLNGYFTNVAENLDKQIPVGGRSPLSYMSPSLPQSFFASPSTHLEVERTISSFKIKNSFPGDVPIYIFKALSEILSPIISELFNESLLCGSFPDCLKIARVIPLFKSGDQTLPKNYRPISTLPTLSKIFERMMHTRLYSYLNRNCILSKHQFGFIAGSSTGDAIVEFLDYAYDSIDTSNNLISVFLDFSKAFDTVNKGVLLAKLNHLGIRGVANDWFKSYLSKRTQYVSLCGVNSESAEVKLGVPQGSILGPLLFLLYINDMSRSSSLLQFVHFADDTTVFASSNNVESLELTVNAELNKIDEWLMANRLSLNIGKTSYMLFGRVGEAGEPTIRIRNVDVTRVRTAKFLGIIIDDRLCFTDHVRSVVAKLSRSLGVMRKISYFVPVQVMINLYYSIVYPHAVYGILAWGRSGLGNSGRVDAKLRRSVKLISHDPRESPYTKYGLLTFDNLYVFFNCVKFFKHHILGEHQYFRSKFDLTEPNHLYQTRFRTGNRLNVPRLQKSKCRASFFYQAIKLWNWIPCELRSLESLNSFRKQLKAFLLSVQ